MDPFSLLKLIPTLISLAGPMKTGMEMANYKSCIPAGCSGQLCMEEGAQAATTCEWKPEYRCYNELGICERRADGNCAWRKTTVFEVCLLQAKVQHAQK